jgi:3',5'-cyclic AMP phosphodiesterase CpdA
MTDPQFGFIEDNKGFEKETALYEKAVQEINRLKPSFVVITGDLVNNRDDKTQIIEFKRITALINPEIPVYYSPGNHDIGQAPVAKDIDEFIKNYGHDRFSFFYKKTLFIGLNSSLIKSNTPLLEQNQSDWLKKELTKGNKAKHIIIFCHYPFFISKADERDEYFNIPLETRKKYLSLFMENRVDAVFAGHLHNNGYGKSGEMEMITTSAVGKPLGKVPSGLRVIKVFPDRIENNYFSLDSIPEKIELIK